MPLDPNRPPPLPPQIEGRKVKRVSGERTLAVTVRDAARLMGVTEAHMRTLVEHGKVDTCRDRERRIHVLVDSLWLLVPEEDRRVERNL